MAVSVQFSGQRYVYDLPAYVFSFNMFSYILLSIHILMFKDLSGFQGFQRFKVGNHNSKETFLGVCV